MSGPFHTLSFMSHDPSSFASGARASLAIALGYFPVGVAFGIAAARMGLSAFEATFLSAAVYAGASQFLVLALLGGGAPLLVSALSIIASNVRHVFYGPALIEKAGDRATKRHAWSWSFFLSDGVFGSALVALGKSKDHFSPRFMFGISAAPYLSWVLGTATGALFGSALAVWPAVDAAMGFLMPALFLAMVLSMLVPAHVPVVIVTVLLTIPAILLFSPTAGVLIGMVAGALSSLAPWERGRERRRR